MHTNLDYSMVFSLEGRIELGHRPVEENCYHILSLFSTSAEQLKKVFAKQVQLRILSIFILVNLVNYNSS